MLVSKNYFRKYASVLDILFGLCKFNRNTAQPSSLALAMCNVNIDNF